MYLRDEEGNPTGVMVAMETDSETLRFGMVRYHPVKEHLPFTKKKAKEIAFARAEKCLFRLPGSYSSNGGRVHTIPEELERQVRVFMAQALERLGITRFVNLYDPTEGHMVNA